MLPATHSSVLHYTSATRIITVFVSYAQQGRHSDSIKEREKSDKEEKEMGKKAGVGKMHVVCSGLLCEDVLLKDNC